MYVIRGSRSKCVLKEKSINKQQNRHHPFIIQVKLCCMSPVRVPLYVTIESITLNNELSNEMKSGVDGRRNSLPQVSAEVTLHHGTHSRPQVVKPPVECEDAVTQSKTTKRTRLKEGEKKPSQFLSYITNCSVEKM